MALVELIDVSLRDWVRRSLTTEDNEGNVEEEILLDPLPEDLMTELEQYAGDGLGKVSVGGDLATSVNFGFKAGASVHIGVTCDSNLDTMMAVHDLLQPRVEEILTRDHARMAAIRADLQEQLTGEKAPRLPEDATPPKVEGRVATPSKAQARVEPTKGPQPRVRPSFRR